MLTKRDIVTVTFFLIGLSTLCLSGANNEENRKRCARRDYGQKSVVCVCNATYCDEAPTVQKITNSSTYIKYTSSEAGLRFRKIEVPFKVYNSSEAAENVIRVDVRTEYQEILGWGGAFSDAAGINIASVSEEVQKKILRSYFGKGSIQYNLCRVPMGATDFSTHPYTYLEEEDLTLSNFSLAEEDFKYKIPFMLQAMNLSENTLKLFGSPWTAPKWMKTSPFYAGTGSIKSELFNLWAKYFERFLDEYKKHGIDFWGVTTGNEPSLAKFVVQTTPTVSWKPEEMRTFIRDHLGPVLRSSNSPDIKIIALDDQRGYLPDLHTILNDSLTYNYVDGFGVHWYQDFYTSAVLLNETHQAFPDKFLLGTEACEGSFLWDTLSRTHVLLGSWDRAESYAYDIMEDINHWVTGWVQWNMALDEQGGPTYTNNHVDAPIIVNSTGDEFYKQPMFYAHGHFSAFVPAGSKRIDISAFDINNGSMYISGFKRPDDGIVMVVLNKLNQTLPINIIDETRQISEIVPARSLTTFLYWD